MMQEDLLRNELYYRARAIVNHLPQPLDRDGISPKSPKHVHAILMGDSQLVMALARHIALIAHYPNFDEKTGANRTLITIVSPEINIDKMEQSQLFGQLLNYVAVTGQDGKQMDESTPCDYLDIAFQLIPQEDYSYEPKDDEIVTIIDTKDKCWEPVLKAVEQTVDVTHAQKINMAYCAGEYLKNIDTNDITNVRAYRRAIHHYGFKLCNRHKCQALWSECSQIDKLSSFYISECLDGYKRSVCGNEKLSKQRLYHTLPALAPTEHLRWCVAQLIAGFRPYSTKEMIHYSTLSVEEKLIDKKAKKAQRIHLDICSNENLAINDFDAIKYDSLLLLVMPKIMK